MNKPFPLVSVCIPVYNGERTIANTIQSVLNQTFSHFELIIVDNASTDDTVKIILKFTDPRIRLIQNSENIGVKANWNKAIKLCTAPYIKLLCADDLIFSECLKKQVAILESPDCLDVAFVACKRLIITSGLTVLFKARGLPGMKGKFTKYQVLKKIISMASNPIGEPAAVLFRHSALDATLCFDTTVPYFVDLDFWLKLLEKGALYAQSEILAAFCVSRSSWSMSMAKQQAYQARKYFQLLKKRNPEYLKNNHYFIMLIKAYALAGLRQVIYYFLKFSK